MLLSFRDAMNIMHGLLFGGFFLLAMAVTFGMLLQPAAAVTRRMAAFWAFTAALGWGAVFTGTYLMYPWYRAPVPAGESLALHPKFKLMADPATIYWHTIGMEWKEHIAFFAPIVLTAVAFIVWRYRGQLHLHPALRRAVLSFTAAALLATGTAGFFGAMLDKLAPVEGGKVITIVQPRGDAK